MRGVGAVEAADGLVVEEEEAVVGLLRPAGGTGQRLQVEFALGLQSLHV